MKYLTLSMCILILSLQAGLKDDLTIITYMESEQAVIEANFPEELMECSHVLVIDGPSTEKIKYNGFDRVLRCPEKLYDGKAINLALHQIETPYFFLHYNGNQIIEEVDVEGVIEAMKTNRFMKHVRLNHKKNLCGKFRDLRLDEVTIRNQNVSFLRAFDWATSDHFSCRMHYQTKIIPKILWPWPVESFLSEKMQLGAKRGLNIHAAYGTYLYGAYGTGPYVSCKR